MAKPRTRSTKTAEPTKLVAGPTGPTGAEPDTLEEKTAPARRPSRASAITPKIGDAIVLRAREGERWGEVLEAPGLVQRVSDPTTSSTAVDVIAWPAGNAAPVIRTGVELGTDEPGTWSPRE